MSISILHLEDLNGFCDRQNLNAERCRIGLRDVAYYASQEDLIPQPKPLKSDNIRHICSR